jgi:ferredoxin
MGFSAYTPLHLLNLQLAICNARFGDFLSSLQKAIVGLQDLLHVGKEPAMSNEGKPAASQYDFADRMISFEEVEKLQPVSAKIPARRSQRIHRCLSTLKAALDYFRENGSRLFASPALASELALNEHVSEATLVKTTSSPCRKAKAYFAKEMQHYVEYIAALRMAELEINNQYDEDLHTPYFDAFSLLNISDEDLQRLPSLVVIDDSEHLMHKSEDFLQLLTESIPVAVMSVNRPGELQISGGEDGGTVFRQELAALAISHRNAYVFQGAADTPALFNTAIRDGLETSSPALWNVLIPDVQDEGEGMGFLKVNTAINARYFPRFVYNVRAGERFGGRFDINHNPQPERTFPSQILDIKTSSGTEKVSYALTTADFFALDPGQRAELEIVPEAYRGEYLIPVSAYLDMPQDHLIGKVPFIWVVSENGVLQQAALPFAWLRRCKERLDYWQFIQELGGVNSYHVHRAIEQAKKDWDAEKENALNQLRSEMEEVIERVRTEEVGLAVERLVTALLDPSSVSAAPAPKPAAQKAAQVIVTPKTGPDPVPEKKDIPAEISSEAWVESFLCTSCNDCTDALPAVFKYNSEKQAIVHNPKGATYAKIVKAAEKCPAQCIHPGLPHNPDEPGLDKLLKRAEKFN